MGDSTTETTVYFRLMVDFARTGEICPPYGDARVVAPADGGDRGDCPPPGGS